MNLPVSHPKVKHPNFFVSELDKFNNEMVDKMAVVLGSVGFIWFCFLLDTVGFVALIVQTIQSIRTHQSLLIVMSLWVSFIAQAFIQLVALPVLQNYQNRQEIHNQSKANADHMALTHIAIQVDKLIKRNK